MPVKANASRQAYAPMFQAQLSEAQTLKQGAGSIEEGVTQEGVQEGTQGTEQALSLEQSQCLSLVLSRSANIFITGAAGTGKSFLLRRIIEQLPQKGEKIGREIAVTASTGVAATHIDGQTLHSFAGIGLGRGDQDKLLRSLSRLATQRWRDLKVLVLDEVSMLNEKLFSALEYIARKVRGNDLPFGGVLLVLCGDFYQLPPVIGKLAFTAGAWGSCNVRTVNLQTVHRQGGDSRFVSLLNEVRVGYCSPQTTQQLQKCHRNHKPLPVDGIQPTRLYPTNKDVDKENLKELQLLPGITYTSRAKDVGPDAAEKAMDKKSPKVLEMKIGAQVMLTRNMPERNLVNGSRGVVESFKQVEEFEGGFKDYDQGERFCPLVRFDNGCLLTVRRHTLVVGSSEGSYKREQLPLRLAWAITVHKSQGMTLSRAEMQLADAFAHGQVYVALSRVQSLAGLWMTGGMVTQQQISAHPDVIAFYSTFS